MSEITQRLKVAIADRYVIERELGAGGMATVYLAQDLKHDRKVALKVLRPELAAVLGAERFVQEIKTTAALQHPHILPLFDSGTADGFLFYVMPFIDGETLRSRLNRENQLGVDEAVKITTEIAEALHYAHTQGVIHRDIKPENILIQNGRPMVADFGIALAVSAAAGGRMTETGLSLGTPHYMSPEQATAEKEITARSDVYSLGSVLYEMLAGSPPHLGGSAQQIIMKIVTEEAAPVTKHRKSVPPHVAAAVAQSIEKLPADRFDTAKAFAEALHNPAFTTATSIAAGVSARPRVRASTVTRGLAVAFVVMTVVATWALFRPVPAPVPTHLRVALASHAMPPGLIGRDLALSPDGRTIVFSDTAGGTRQLWIKTADRAEAQALAGTTGARAPAFSPDAEWIAFVAEGRLRKVPRTGGSAITIGDSAEMSFVPSVAWLDDGRIAYTNQQFGVRIVGEDGGPARSFFVTPGSGVASIAAIPGDQAVFAAVCAPGCPAPVLSVLDLETGTFDSLSEGGLRAWSLADGRVAFVRQDGGVLAARWDARGRRFAASPVPVLDGVQSGATEADMALAVNGTLLYVPGAAVGGGAPAELVWVSRAGVASPVDSGWSIVPSGNGGIRLSPDGRRVALAVVASGSDDIWIKDLESGPFTRLTFAGVNSRPEWSRDGRSVLYSSATSAGSGDARLLRRRADGTGGVDTVLTVTRPVWEVQLPVDTHLTVVRFGVPPSRDIYLLDRRLGTGDSALTAMAANDAYEEVAVALSPDGRWLAYASNESGRYEIYVRPFPDASAGRWQVSRDGGNEPRWAHSGRELFYRRTDGNLIAVTIPPGAAFTTGEQRVLFQAGGFFVNTAYAEYDVGPDDRRFLFKRFIARAGDVQLANTAVLVQHWLTELDARVGGRR